MMLESYSITNLLYILALPKCIRRCCPGKFTCLLCSKKNWRIMQPMKARSDDDPIKYGKIEQYLHCRLTEGQVYVQI